eukprot:TRINITY_DN66336_c6_g2_i1.p1 TRINITY_DN66336_c6_g2~~TRINITY_DN66336_c6_g2_i1.p1  ORF type:complete len:149 (+),score=72.34 TRINITY_DN66336_c6_g2_i1:347-793(+)
MKVMGVSILHVLGVTLSHQVTGALWYGPLFGETFIRLAYPLATKGKDKDKDLQPTPMHFVYTIIGAALMVFSLEFVLQMAGAKTIGDAVATALMLWVLQVGTAMVHHKWESRPLGLLVLHESFHLVQMSINAALLTVSRAPLRDIVLF